MSARERRAEIERELLPHLDALYRYGMYLTRDRTEAEDLAQETLVKAVNAFEQFRPGTNGKAWLFKIMTNTFLNHQRRRAWQVELNEGLAREGPETEDLPTFVQANRSVEESFLTQLSRTKVREGIENLPREFRSVVVLADLEELSYKEIADVLCCPIGTVMSRLHRGRRLLRVILLEWARALGLVAPAPDAAETPAADLDNVAPLSAYRSRSDKTASREDSP